MNKGTSKMGLSTVILVQKMVGLYDRKKTVKSNCSIENGNFEKVVRNHEIDQLCASI